MAVVVENKEWEGAEDSDDGEPAIERRQTERYQRRESRIAEAVLFQNATQAMGDKEVDVHQVAAEWKSAGDEEEEAGAGRERAASEAYLRRESRLARSTSDADGAALGDREVALVCQDTDWGQDVDSDDGAGDEGAAAQATNEETFKRRESRLIEAPDLHDDRIVGDVQLDVMAQGKEWAQAGDSDEEDGQQDLAATEAFKRRETRLAHTLPEADQGFLGDKEVNLQAQETDWAHDDSSSDDDDTMETVATEFFKRRETRLIDAPDLNDDRVFGDVQLDVVNQAKEWAAGEDSDEEAAQDAHEGASYQRRESRLASALAVPEDAAIGDQDVTLIMQDSGWREDTDSSSSEDEGHARDEAATEVFKRRETRLLEAPALDDDTVVGDKQLDVVKQSQEWAQDDGSDDDDDGPRIERVATESRERRESRIASAAAEAEIAAD